ncbi:hypothetical protein D9M72_646210 [compost metagenome]
MIQEHAVADIAEELVNPVKPELCQQVHGGHAQRYAGGHFGIERSALYPSRHDGRKHQGRHHGGAGSDRQILRLRFVQVAAAQEHEQHTRQ